jgi:signal transduction histidine kinase
VADEVTSILRFLRREMEGSDIQVVARLPDEKLYVYIDRNRLRQITLNLLNNAREAIGTGGRIEVSIERKDKSIVIEVKDTGPGVPKGERQRIFEPFYSTKQLGTGLGLPLVRRFVEEGGGNIEYVDRPQSGACFRLTLREAVPPRENKNQDSSSSPQPMPATASHVSE